MKMKVGIRLEYGGIEMMTADPILVFVGKGEWRYARVNYSRCG
jgi:hypothetical protein